MGGKSSRTDASRTATCVTNVMDTQDARASLRIVMGDKIVASIFTLLNLVFWLVIALDWMSTIYYAENQPSIISDDRHDI